ncbi:MAG: helix-turn-helix transcriptional regulator [Robiginitomaculum sp.]|nr:helix-turn-helix transcriptional regulator [Robiginitomaculum sp.]
MGWSDLLKDKSSLATAVNLVGDRWSLLLLSGCFFGICRFNQFESFLGINRNLLSSRLDKLVESGLLVRHLYNENPKRYEYQLTDISRELRPIITGLATWGERNFTKEDAPFAIVHKVCEHKIDVVIHCAECGTHVGNDDIATKINPGAGPEAIRLFENMSATAKIID